MSVRRRTLCAVVIPVAARHKRKRTSVEQEEETGPDIIPQQSRVFHGLRIGLTGFQSDKRNLIRDLIQQQGAEYYHTLTKHVTHLVAASKRSGRYKFAISSNIPVVSERWVHESLRLGRRLEEAAYDPYRPLLEQGKDLVETLYGKGEDYLRQLEHAEALREQPALWRNYDAGTCARKRRKLDPPSSIVPEEATPSARNQGHSASSSPHVFGIIPADGIFSDLAPDAANACAEPHEPPEAQHPDAAHAPPDEAVLHNEVQALNVDVGDARASLMPDGVGEPTRPIRVEPPEQAKQQASAMDNDSDPFLPPGSTAFWNDFSPQFERAEQVFSRSATHERLVFDTSPRVWRDDTHFALLQGRPAKPSSPPATLIWKLDGLNIPPGVKKVYAVRRGHKAGFYLAWDGPDGARMQVEGAIGNSHKSFKNTSYGLENAVHFMNHAPADCRFSCNPPCRMPQDESTELAPKPYRHLKPYDRCAACNVELGCKKAILCRLCALSPDADPVLEKCIEDAKLCDEQADVLRLVAQGQNMFYTGAAGTGKSTVLKAIVQYLRAHRRDVEVLSPTGITALNVNGITIHSFAAWGITVDERPLSKVRTDAGRKRVWDKIHELEVLIIDEISMVSSNTMVRLDNVLQHVMKNNQPFGGLQVIFTGDLYQLPPVKPFDRCLECGLKTVGLLEIPHKPRRYECAEHGIYSDDDKWAFRSQTWDDLKLCCKDLVKIHRQSDPTFTGLLNKCRLGTLTPNDEDLLWYHDYDVDKSAIRIYPRRETVDNKNTAELMKLQGVEVTFNCVDSFHWNDDKGDMKRYELCKRWERVKPDDEQSPFVSYTEDRHRYDDRFQFRQGMPVVLLSKVHGKHKLVNGSQGTIIGFESYNPGKVPRTRRNRKEEHSLDQWIFMGDHAQYQEDEVQMFCDRAAASERLWPIVRFKNNVTCTIYPYCEVHKIGADEPYSLMSRTQIPLLAAWAITTHKSQGMELDKAEINMSDAWEHGQMYTALSRVRTLDGLKVSGMAHGKACRADPTVQGFMEETTWVQGAG